uniref:NADH dehydrogenase subunit 6 n=1 Tax=Deroceras reticulatum TaxID=145610 RepID=A0A343ERM7_DERRE|nr:NADH dehydrogenase subunit 6 [Deroceras reticulatum]ASL05733.1 NADH dehydrogenase subunit 6 [Deroceras reticulatum]
MEVMFIMMLTFVSSMFMLVGNPMMIGVLLLILSLFMVGQIGYIIGSWYAYILFLVYVGGLLVMFIYICMISSNLQLTGVLSLSGLGTMMIIMSVVGQYVNNHKMLTHVEMLSGVNFPLSLLLMLGVYLLICFLSVISIILSGGTSINIENN